MNTHNTIILIYSEFQDTVLNIQVVNSQFLDLEVSNSEEFTLRSIQKKKKNKDLRSATAWIVTNKLDRLIRRMTMVYSSKFLPIKG